MYNVPTLHDAFSYTGLWWLPDQEEGKWPGTLSFKPEEGARLELFFDQDKKLPNLYGKLPRLLGILKVEIEEVYPRNIVTLLDCEVFSSKSISGMPVYVIHVGYILRGLYYSQEEDIVFKSVSIEYTSLTGWMPPVASISSDMQRDDDDQSLIQIDAKYQKIPPVEIRVSTIDSKLCFSTWLQSLTSSREIHWRQSYSTKIVPDTSQSLGWYVDEIFRVRDLLSFLTGLPVEPKSIVADVSAQNITNSNSDQTIYVYHSVRLPKQDEEFDFKMPFPLQRLGDQSQDVFETWFNLCEAQLVPYVLCLDVINNAHRFWQFEFLALVQALESHHRLYFEKEGRRQGKYRNEKGEIKKNGPDFIDRLQELREQFPKKLSQGPELVDDFLNSIVKTRNYYTHYTPKYRKHALKNLDLYKANTRIIPFIAYFLYRELGIPDDVVHEGFEATSYRGLWKPRLQDDELTQDDS